MSIRYDTINDILSDYIWNVILHSHQHITITIYIFLFGRFTWKEIETYETIQFFHDSFGKNMSFWLDSKFAGIIQQFQCELKSVDSYAKSRNLNKVFGLDKISAGISS